MDRFEDQNRRIVRLGPSSLWHGQSDFWVPYVLPALEGVVAPNGWEGICAHCGKTIQTSPALGVRVIVKHQTRTAYEVYHPECAPTGVPYIYEQWRTAKTREELLSTRLPGF